MANSNIFSKVVERSYLDQATKDEFLAAASQGVTPQLWTRLNNLLIDDLSHRQEMEQKASSQLDEEINRFTGEYEQEKTILDRKMMDELKTCQEDETRRQRLWDDYRRKINALQQRMTVEVKRTSTTILRQVVMTMVSTPWPH